MKSKVQIFAAFMLGCVLMSCAGWAYRYYGLELPDQCYDDGKLLGPKPENDISLIECKPDQAVKGKCAVVFIDEYQRERNDLVRCQDELKNCQAGH